LAVVLATRPPILLVGYLAAITFGYAAGAPPSRLSSNEALNLPLRWDAGWYLGIAANGYGRRANAEGQQNIVFFPAYPMAVRAVGRLFGGTLGGQVVAGLLISHLAFLGALVYLYALARDTLDEDHARYALWLVGCYPFAVFFGAVYTESLFLLAATGTFFHFSRRQFWPAAGWGLLLGLTRPQGCLLSIPLALMAFRRPNWKAVATAAAPGVGMLIYSGFIWRLTGDPFAWVAGQGAWSHRSGPFDIRDYTDVLNDLGVAFGLVAVWPVARRFGAAYALFILVSVLPALATHGPVSAGRYSAVLFPAFLWFADVVPKPQRSLWLAIFSVLQAVIAALFYSGRAMY
jgi:hypothetical protein